MLSEKLYEKGYSSLDLLNYIETQSWIDITKRYELLVCIQKIKKEFRNEKLLFLFILNFIFIRSNFNLENIPFM